VATRWVTAGIAAAVLLLTQVATAQAPAPTAPPRPITIAEALTLAAQNNLALRVAAYDVSIAQQQVARAEALARGALSLDGSYQYAPPTTFVILAGTIPGVPTITLPALDPNVYSVAVTYQYPLYTGGKIQAQIALAQANLTGAAAVLERQELDLMFQVNQAYDAMIVARDGVDIYLGLVASAAENYSVARTRVATGESSTLDGSQAELNLANTQDALLRAQNDLVLAQQNVDQLLNLPLTTPLQPREESGVPPLHTDLPALIQLALQRRPEVVELQARLAASQAAVEIARSGQRPFFTLAVEGAYGNTVIPGSLIGGIATAQSGWDASLLGTLTLFDGGLTAATVRAAELQVAQVQAAQVLLTQSIEAEVRRAFADYTSAAAEVTTTTTAAGAARRSVRIASIRFSTGVSDYLEVFTAQSALSQAEAARLAASLAVNIDRAQIDRAVGGPGE